MLAALALLAVVQPSQIPPETKQFDFWVGNWNATGKMSAEPGRWQDTEATNRISRVMDGYAVQEEFKMAKLHGSSWSVYDARLKQWHQTWVDNQGSYIALAGKFEGGAMVLTTLPDPIHPKAMNRMTYHNITPKEFDWDWEASRDGGATWNLQWHLHYTRR